MGPFCQDSLRLRGWILSALLAFVSWPAPLGASDSMSVNRLLGGALRADAQLEQQVPSERGPILANPLERERRRGLKPPPDEGAPTPTVLTPQQREDLLRSDFEKMKRDAAELTTLAQSLQAELEKSNEHTLSIKIVEKAKRIERLAKNISKTAKSH